MIVREKGKCTFVCERGEREGGREGGREGERGPALQCGMKWRARE